ncbi:head-tail connector protein [Actinobacillus equuli subsp. equuli]|uniref:head-tail connector protein n=1 Tax=Actinobacillus equuli TaxID=718 RepID=UPI0024414F5E|nr:head-tail connector protein [Actinobacillus equuli]WGE65978.1 head-tail connector protein [Actinobacillus equuli subsp. equuli]
MNVSISLDEIKAHLRIEHDLDDSLLDMLAESALEVAQNYIGKTWGENNTEQEVRFTSGIKVGCLMFIGHLYANRETVADVQLYEVPFAISALWNPYREPSIY